MNKIYQIALLILLATPLDAQDAQFGGHVGVAIYRLRTEIAGQPPKAGWAVGGDANLAMGKKGLIRFMPQAGLILGNTEGGVDPANPFFSNLTGRPVPLDTKVRTLTYYFQGATLLKFSSNTDDKFGFFIGPAIHYVLGRTFILSYPVPGQDEPFQERISGLDSQKQLVYFMAYLGAEVRLTPPEKFGLYGYIHTFHQLDIDPLLPAGFTFGVKVMM